jgi:predicted exporter
MRRLLTAVLLIALGVLAGLGMYAISVVILFAVGFSFYAVGAGVLLAFLLCLIGAPISYFRSRKRGPQFTERLGFSSRGCWCSLLRSVLT